MRLSKKVAYMFIATTLSAAIMLFMSSNLMIKYFYKGENTRILGRSEGTLNRINAEIDKMYGKTKDYASLINSASVFENRDGINDARKVLGLESKFENDKIDLKIVLDKNHEMEEIFNNSSSFEYTSDRVEKILEITNTHLGDINTDGFLSVDDEVFIYALEPIIEKVGNTITGYFLTVDIVDDTMLNLIGESMGNIIVIENTIDNDKIRDNIKIDKDDNNIDIIYGEDSVYSYYKLELANENITKYIKIEEDMVIREDITKNIMTFSIISVLAFSLINTLLYLIIRKLVVKRIVILNKGINKIKESKDLKERITLDNIKDEIGVLTDDINEMFNSLEEADTTLEIKEKKYANILNTMSNGFAYFKEIRDEDGNFIDAEIVDYNSTYMKLVGEKEEHIKTTKISDYSSNNAKKIEYLKDILSKNITQSIPLEEKLPNGNWVSASFYKIEEGYFAIILNDITKIKEYSEEMSYLASYDILTELLNRYNLYTYMEELKAKEKRFTIFFIDLDNFKNLNDTLGHNTGDQILCLVAKELTNLADENMVVGRLGGDEFIVIKEDLEEDKVEVLGTKILETLNRNINFNNYTFQLRASVGASMYPNHTDDIETLLQYADISMYEVKNEGGNNIKIFSEHMHEKIVLESKLVESIENNELEVYYQPIFDILTDKVTSAEALIRWNLEGNVVPPDKFIYIAKKNGFIVDLDHFVLIQSCKFCKKIREEILEDFKVSVNMSYLYLKQPRFKEVVEEVLKDVGLDPSALKIEITEDEILDDLRYVLKVLDEVKELGVMVSLDDFGVGYSNFNHVKVLPIDTLKIDKSILVMSEEDNKIKAIIETLINFAHTLGLDVVCEGVEIEEQFDFLKRLNCDKIQGYLISKPVKEKDFYPLMNK